MDNLNAAPIFLGTDCFQSKAQNCAVLLLVNVSFADCSNALNLTKPHFHYGMITACFSAALLRIDKV